MLVHGRPLETLANHSNKYVHIFLRETILYCLNQVNSIFMTHGVNDRMWPVDKTLRVEKGLVDGGTCYEAIYFKNEDHNLEVETAQLRHEKVLRF